MTTPKLPSTYAKQVNPLTSILLTLARNWTLDVVLGSLEDPCMCNHIYDCRSFMKARQSLGGDHGSQDLRLRSVPTHIHQSGMVPATRIQILLSAVCVGASEVRPNCKSYRENLPQKQAHPELSEASAGGQSLDSRILDVF